MSELQPTCNGVAIPECVLRAAFDRDFGWLKWWGSWMLTSLSVPECISERLAEAALIAAAKRVVRAKHPLATCLNGAYASNPYVVRFNCADDAAPLDTELSAWCDAAVRTTHCEVEPALKPEPEPNPKRKSDKHFWIGVDPQGQPIPSTAAHTEEQVWDVIVTFLIEHASITPEEAMTLDKMTHKERIEWAKYNNYEVRRVSLEPKNITVEDIQESCKHMCEHAEEKS